MSPIRIIRMRALNDLWRLALACEFRQCIWLLLSFAFLCFRAKEKVVWFPSVYLTFGQEPAMRRRRRRRRRQHLCPRNNALTEQIQILGINTRTRAHRYFTSHSSSSTFSDSIACTISGQRWQCVCVCVWMWWSAIHLNALRMYENVKSEWNTKTTVEKNEKTRK